MRRVIIACAVGALLLAALSDFYRGSMLAPDHGARLTVIISAIVPNPSVGLRSTVAAFVLPDNRLQGWLLKELEDFAAFGVSGRW
jgi:hypothetical protein